MEQASELEAAVNSFPALAQTVTDADTPDAAEATSILTEAAAAPRLAQRVKVSGDAILERVAVSCALKHTRCNGVLVIR